MWSECELPKRKWKRRRCGNISRPARRRLARERPNRDLDFVDLLLGGLDADFDRFAGAMKLEQPDRACFGHDDDIGWVAGEPRPCDAVLRDVDRVHHHGRNARRAIAPAKNLPVQQMHSRAAVAAGKLGLLGERNGFGQDSVIVNDAAPAEGVAAQIDGDYYAGAKGAAHRYRDGIDKRAVDQPAAIDLDGAEDAGQDRKSVV